MVVSVLEEAFGEEIVSKFARLFEPVHSHHELIVYPSVVGVSVKLIFVDGFLRPHTELDVCIIWAIKRCHEVEVFKIGGHEPCIWGGECAVQHQFDSFQGSCLGSAVA